jgi:cell division protein FtsB
MTAIPPSRTPRRHDTRRVGQVRRAVLAISLTVGVILVADALFGERGLLALVRTQRQVAALEADIERAEAENQRIQEQVRRLQQDPTAIEELARRELGLIKPGEKLFIIRDVPSPQPAR